MSRKHHYTVEQRSAAVRRIYAGEYIEAIALEFKVSVHSVNDWCSCWKWRRGVWIDQPLEAVEVELGFRIDHDGDNGGYNYGGRAQVIVPDSARDNSTENDAVAAFLYIIGRAPTVNRSPLEAAFQALSDHHREMLTPAFDTYLRAVELDVEMRRLKALAVELAARELATVKPTRRAAAWLGKTALRSIVEAVAVPGVS